MGRFFHWAKIERQRIEVGFFQFLNVLRGDGRRLIACFFFIYRALQLFDVGSCQHRSSILDQVAESLDKFGEFDVNAVSPDYFANRAPQ